MAKPSVVTKQNDFSAGEVDPQLKRSDDHPSLKIGARQASNWRILNAKGVKNRPGRRVLFLDGVGASALRVEEVLMAPGQKFYIVFANLALRVYNAAGTNIFGAAAMPWTTATAPQIVWDIYQLSIYITFPGMRPKVLTWDGVSQVSTWSLSDYTETVIGSQKRTVFTRLSPLGVTMGASGVSGSVSLVFSVGMNLTAAHIGTRMRYYGRQLLITAVADATHATATVIEPLHHATSYVSQGNVDLTQYFALGDVLIGAQTASEGIAISYFTSVNPNDGIIVQRKTAQQFIVGAPGTAEIVASQTGAIDFSSIISGTIAPQQILVWDDEVINTLRGYPASCFVDQNRLGLCDFPALPGLVVWSALGSLTDLYTDDQNVGPTNAIQEVVPGKSRVLYVMSGTESSEFVFCDNAVYYIPISPSTPLQPGSVSFNLLTSDGAAQIKPARVQQSIVYFNSGAKQVKAVQAVGAFSRPYIVEDISALHFHLLTGPVAIAVPSGSTQFEERYIYVLNADGSIVVGKHTLEGGLLDTKSIGWLPWSGQGTATWVSASGTDLIFSSSYLLLGGPAFPLVEALDDTLYLDMGMLYNAAPASLPPPVGKGPLWWRSLDSVDVMDGPLGTRMMGTYLVDANGFLIPQGNAGEDFTSPNLVVGKAWSATLEPFIPSAQAGQNFQQRMWKRRLKRVQVYVQNSTGFVMQRLFGGPITPTSPAVGTVMKSRRITTWNQDDDPTQPPPLREQSYLDRPIGWAHDPRWCIVKDTPGPLTILEISTEVTV